MAVRLIALQRGEKAAPLAFNFHLLLAHEMTISLFQLSNVRDWLVIAAVGFNSSVFGEPRPWTIGRIARRYSLK
jgi:hypothetical protein